MECYCVDAAMKMAVADVLESYGLDATPFPASRKPARARTFADQERRVNLGSAVVAEVRREMPVGRNERRFIHRRVDAACARLEEAERPPKPATCSGGSVAALIAYAAGGGGALGSFESFQRRFLSDAALLEPTVVPLVARQDVKPSPMTNPSRRPDRQKPPGTAAPAKANPSRTIRSVRWIGKGATR